MSIPKKLKILFENESVVVVDKPAGVSVFGSDYKHSEHKDLNSVDEYLLKNKKTKEYIIVHRLDKDTTGCLLVAKKKAAFENLKQQFQNKQVRKEYVAVVWGTMKFDTGIIDGQIARSKSDFRKHEVVKNSLFGKVTRGTEREAVTRYRVVERVEKFGEKMSLVKFYPETGRTHQIRVHAKSLGHPIVADHLYGPGGERAEKLEKKLFKVKTKAGAKNVRQLLHAASVTFIDPETDSLVKIESKLPKEFKLI